jgi:hypothetical protein
MAWKYSFLGVRSHQVWGVFSHAVNHWVPGIDSLYDLEVTTTGEQS